MEKKQTAVDWLFEEINRIRLEHEMENIDSVELLELQDKAHKEAKAMEKEQIMEAARKCHFEGVRQSAKTSEGYIEYGNQYYTKTYESK